MQLRNTFTFVSVACFFTFSAVATGSVSSNNRIRMSFGQFAATSQFYLFGRNRCTKTGYDNAKKSYAKPDILANGVDSKMNLSEKIFMITGANGGIGKEITTFLAKQNATVYMVCRNAARGQAARDEIAQVSKNEKVHLILGDCGLEKDVRRIWSEFTAHREATDANKQVKLDSLVCNAGALLNELTISEEEVEVTFATHLLFGTYLLGNLAMPVLEETPDSRLVVVSSGGMYNTAFPEWEIATSTGNAKYDGQFAYAYAKRGQVLLCEKWAQQFEPRGVKVVSCHPGWTMTGGVEAAYGESKKYLEPLRTLWQGSEGIVWLCVAPASELVGGEFYLDRIPQVKHMSGPFFSEGSFTKNTAEEVNTMLLKLDQWSKGVRPTRQQSDILAAQNIPLIATTQAIDINKFMGDWNVLANIPSSLEVGATNCIEKYTYDEAGKAVKITFEYGFANRAKDSKSTSQMKMRGNVISAPTSTHWTIDPKLFGFTVPFGLNYLVLDTAEDYSYTMIGVPDRSYLWIMIRNEPTEFIPPSSGGGSVSVMDAYGAELQLIPPTFNKLPSATSINVSGSKKEQSQGEEEDSKEVMSGEGMESPTQEVTKLSADITSSASTSAAAGSSPWDAAQSSVEMQAAAAQASTPEGRRAYEIAVLRRALFKAEELGYDVKKVMRCGWMPAKTTAATAAATKK
mmetsp:Transcript_17225/g.28900  ORF Transcript_17225/g.28900 Transcript_17225/m.28900 type:complete len:685 (+) Transcript_17225:83-2137(+)